MNDNTTNIVNESKVDTPKKVSLTKVEFLKDTWVIDGRNKKGSIRNIQKSIANKLANKGLVNIIKD